MANRGPKKSKKHRLKCVRCGWEMSVGKAYSPKLVCNRGEYRPGDPTAKCGGKVVSK